MSTQFLSFARDRKPAKMATFGTMDLRFRGAARNDSGESAYGCVKGWGTAAGIYVFRRLPLDAARARRNGSRRARACPFQKLFLIISKLQSDPGQ